MSNIKIENFSVIGITVRTTNENQQASKDIGALWEKFSAGNIAAQIPNKVSDDIYNIYTDYESDYTKPYTVILGYKVDSLKNIPKGLIGKSIEAGTYTKITAKGKKEDMFVFKAWQQIWKSDLRRAYTADFEVYGVKSQQPEAEVDIFISLLD